MKVLFFHVKGIEAKHITWLMASNPIRLSLFKSFSSLKHSGPPFRATTLSP